MGFSVRVCMQISGLFTTLVTNVVEDKKNYSLSWPKLRSQISLLFHFCVAFVLLKNVYKIVACM